MESFLPSEIARLVLGYLEDQKCEEAYSTFLKTSVHLEECLKMKEDGRKFRTQVLGLSLLDILYEYSAIYSLVQERLKKVDPEAVDRLKHSGTLLDKITFLLNSTSSGQTMLFSISLPPGNSPQSSTVAHAHVRKRLRTSSNDKRKDISKKNFKVNDNIENSIIEAGNNIHNFETTNLSSLPGNSIQNITGQENDIIRTPKRKIQGNNNNKRQSRANSVAPEELEENFDITALTQALLDNHELHEKIAENINKVICTPENSSNISMGLDPCSAQNPILLETNTTLPNSNNFTMELDNVIKKIVHDTESDPIFENFLHEVVGPPGQEETSDDYDDRGISNTSTPSKFGPETVKKQNLKNRNRNVKLKRANSTENIANTIDDHNAVAIESIISINAPEIEKICSVPTTTEIIKNIEDVSATVSTIISTKTSTVTDTAVIVSKIAANNINPVVVSSLPITTPAEINQNLTVDTTNVTNTEQNKNALILEQQCIHQPTFVIADPFPSFYPQPTITSDNRIIFLSNKTPASTSQYLTMPQTFQISQPATVISNNDILNLPTVFISDDPKTSSGYIISQTGSKRPLATRKTATKPKSRMTPRKLLQKMDPSMEVELSTTTQETDNVKYTINIQAEPKQTIDTNAKPIPSTSGSPNLHKKDATNILAEKNITPEKTNSTSNSKLQLSLSSPRSNKSHIRALDFSTPQKEDLSPRKTKSSPKSLQKVKVTNKVNKSPKNINLKKIGTVQFVSPVKSRKVPIATKSPKVKLKGDWNEDLVTTNKITDNDKHKKSPKLRRSCVEKDSSLNKSEDKDEKFKLCDCVIKPSVKKFTSWDEELRSLIVPIPSTSQPKKTPPKKRTRTSQRNKEGKDKKPTLNTTEVEVISIEAELAKMEEIDQEKEPTKEVIAEDKEKEIVTEETKPSSEKRKKQNSKSKIIVQKVELNIREEILSTPEKTKEIEKPEETNNISNTELNKSISADSLRNMTPKIRKKCNTSSSSKKTPTNSDENKTKSVENETNNQTIEVKEMTILSPSKMDKNASKRTLVELQTEKEFLVPPQEANKSQSSIITPNMLKATCSNEVTTKRNLIPVLETPMKDDSLLLPITPRLFTPFNLDSPLTRLLGEKMNTGDLAPFLSPSFPMTPSFPITPNLQSGDTQSSYASRPTDYSNSSSYYQPSDSEQTQKLEQVLIDEAMKIETSLLKPKDIKTSTPCDSVESTTAAVTNAETEMINSKTGITAKVRLSGSLLEESNNSKKSINTSQSSLDSSSASSSTTIFSSSSNDDSTENINKDETNVTVIQAVPDKVTNKTLNKEKVFSKTNSKELYVKLIKTPVTKKQVSSNIKNDDTGENKMSKEPIKRARGRPKSPLKRLNEKAKRPPGRPRKDTVQDKTKQDDGVEIIEKYREIKSKVTGSHVKLLEELEEKRKRIITGLNVNKPGRPKKKITKEDSKECDKGNLRVTRASVNKTELNKKPETIKTVPTKLADKVPKPPLTLRKLKTPQKASIESVAAKLLKDKKSDATNTELNQSSSTIYSVESPNVSISIISQDDGLISHTPDEEIPRLHISSDEEALNQSNTNENKIDDSDLLVKELKERGIYLIPNKEKKIEQLVKEKQNEETNDEKCTEQLKTKEKSDKIEIKSDIRLDKHKVIDVSKIELSQGVITDVISRTLSKKNEVVQENIVATIKDASKETVNKSDSILDVSESSDYDFHVKVINESSPEFIHFTYDETNKTEKKLSYYNFTVLERNISAKIYIEEFDKWEDKTFTVTPYIDIYSMTPKRKQKPTNKTDNHPKVVPTNKGDNNTVKITKAIDSIKNKKIIKPNETISKTVETETKTNLKPLEILYNVLCVDESSTDTIITVKESEPKMKLTKLTNSNENDKKEKQISKDNVTSIKSGVKKTISLEQYKMNKNKDNKGVQKTKDEVDLECVEIIETSMEEDLTNSMLINQELNTKKRKGSEDIMKQNADKRIKPNDKHALLKSIDVDSFLTKVHGPSPDKS